jgi:hypothetical protein
MAMDFGVGPFRPVSGVASGTGIAATVPSLITV